VNFVLVGNKCDLVAQRKVSFEEGRQFAENNSMTFYETSTETG